VYPQGIKALPTLRVEVEKSLKENGNKLKKVKEAVR